MSAEGSKLVGVRNDEQIKFDHNVYIHGLRVAGKIIVMPKTG